jgi:hypothetical protein
VICLDPLTRHSHAPLVGAPLDFTALRGDHGGAPASFAPP